LDSDDIREYTIHRPSGENAALITAIWSPGETWVIRDWRGSCAVVGPAAAARSRSRNGRPASATGRAVHRSGVNIVGLREKTDTDGAGAADA
jgi:hypothetical protein